MFDYYSFWGGSRFIHVPKEYGDFCSRYPVRRMSGRRLADAIREMIAKETK